MPLSVLLLLLAPPVLAAPDRVAAVLEGPSESIDLVALPDDEAVVFADPTSGSVALLDLRDWSIDTASVCTGAVGAVPIEVDGELRVYTGCDDGTVTWLTVDDGDLTTSGQSLELDAGELLGLAAEGDYLYAVAEQSDDGGNPRVHIIDPASDAVDGDVSDSFPTTLGHGSYADVESGGGFLYVLSSGDNLSKVTVPGGGATTEYNGLGDLDGRDLVVSSSGGSVLAGGGVGVARFNADNEWALLIDDGVGLTDVLGLCLIEEEEVLLVVDDDEVKQFPWSSSSGNVGNDQEASFLLPDSGEVPTELVLVDDGWVISGTEDGPLYVMTDRPWVEVTATTPDVGTEGDSIQVSFESDTDGEVELRLGGADGDVLAESTATAGVSQTLSVSVDDGWIEGDNYLRVVVTDDAGLAGHDSAVVSVDSPPPAIAFSEDDVGWADSALDVTFTAPSDEDIESVRIYITTTAFAADDWPDGGPDFDGDDDLDTDALTVTVSPDEDVAVRIYPLTNDQTYYLAVRATDAGGLEGPMSNVVTGTPQETFGVAELAGDQGGFCGAAGGAASLLLAGLAGGIGALRRRRGVGAAAAVLAVGLAAPGVARAADGDNEDQVSSSLDVRFGPMYWDDSNEISQVLGDSGHNVLWLEYGPSWRGIAGITVGTGFYRKKGTLVSATGASSSQDSVLWTVPLTLNLTARLDVLPEQWVVPYASVGGDYWFWREGWNESDELGDRAGVGGGKYGWHYAVGGQILLDMLERGRADTAMSRLGIHDTYATVEWRSQEVGASQSGLDLSNEQLTFGLRLHY